MFIACILLAFIVIFNTLKIEAKQSNQLIEQYFSQKERLTNILLVYPEKIDQDNIRIIFRNVGLDTVDSVTATLIIWQDNNKPFYKTIKVTKLSPVTHQSFRFHCVNWKQAKMSNIVATDGSDKNMPIKDGDYIYNN